MPAGVRAKGRPESKPCPLLLKRTAQASSNTLGPRLSSRGCQFFCNKLVSVPGSCAHHQCIGMHQLRVATCHQRPLTASHLASHTLPAMVAEVLPTPAILLLCCSERCLRSAYGNVTDDVSFAHLDCAQSYCSCSAQFGTCTALAYAGGMSGRGWWWVRRNCTCADRAWSFLPGPPTPQ